MEVTAGTLLIFEGKTKKSISTAHLSEFPNAGAHVMTDVNLLQSSLRLDTTISDDTSRHAITAPTGRSTNLLTRSGKLCQDRCPMVEV